MRAQVGPKLLIVGCPHLQSNLTHRMLQTADALMSFRTDSLRGDG
jgi:microcystin degradation protein MlrC